MTRRPLPRNQAGVRRPGRGRQLAQNRACFERGGRIPAPGQPQEDHRPAHRGYQFAAPASGRNTPGRARPDRIKPPGTAGGGASPCGREPGGRETVTGLHREGLPRRGGGPQPGGQRARESSSRRGGRHRYAPSAGSIPSSRCDCGPEASRTRRIAPLRHGPDRSNRPWQYCCQPVNGADAQEPQLVRRILPLALGARPVDDADWTRPSAAGERRRASRTGTRICRGALAGTTPPGASTWAIAASCAWAAGSRARC